MKRGLRKRVQGMLDETNAKERETWSILRNTPAYCGPLNEAFSSLEQANVVVMDTDGSFSRPIALVVNQDLTDTLVQANREIGLNAYSSAVTLQGVQVLNIGPSV